MKKSRLILLVILYGIVCFGMLILQWFSIQNAQLKMIVNIGTLLMAALMLMIVSVQYRNNQHQSTKEDCKEQNYIPSKEEYLSYVADFSLTKREKEIGYLILNGYSNARVSAELFISEATVKKHLSHLYEKTDTTGRKEKKNNIQNFCLTRAGIIK